MNYRKVTIFGMGLIGGAIGIDLKKKGLAEEVCGWGRNTERLRQAIEKRACDTTTREISDAIKNSEIIVLATPPKIIKSQLIEIKPHLKEGMLLMDAGSVKGSIIEASQEAKIYETGAEFLGCHPMAGSEKSGIINAVSGMLKNAPCIITPDSNNTIEGVEKGKKFWRELGSKIVIMDPDEHDLFVGFMSHLPHILSSTLVNTSAEKLKDTELMSKLCGPSFIEVTRIASSSPEMWSQIYLENRKPVLLAIDSFLDRITKFKDLLTKKENKKIEKFMQNAARYKEDICPSE
jgi:prephenate dehydrogenase